MKPILISPNSRIVTFYPYRTAVVVDSIVKFNLHSLDLSQYTLAQSSLSEYLKANGLQLGNHTCWTTEDGLCYGYRDGVLTIGHDVLILFKKGRSSSEEALKKSEEQNTCDYDWDTYEDLKESKCK